MARSFSSKVAGPGTLLAGVLALTFGGSARGAESPNAPVHIETDDELIAAGIERRKQGQDSEALAMFERAYTLRPTPRAMAQVALAHQALGHWVDAEAGLVETLRHLDDDWVTRRRTYLEESLVTVRTHLAWLDVQGDLPGAEVWVAGQRRGSFPLRGPLRVLAGDFTLEIRAAGYPAIRRTLHLDPSSSVHEAVAFGVPAPGEHAPTPGHADRPAESTRRDSRTAGWGLLAGAGGLLLVGGAALVTREWEAQIYDGSGCAPSGDVPRSMRCTTNRDIGMTAQTTAIVSLVGAGGAAIGSVLLLLTSPKPSKLGALRCSFGTAGIACGGNW